MRLLLDTHFLLWATIDPEAIRARERALIADSETFVSPISLWELRLKWQRRRPSGERKGILDPDLALAYIASSALELAVLTGVDCATQLRPEIDHGDPFDEQLLIHAQQLDAKLLTRDRMLLRHPLAYRFT